MIKTQGFLATFRIDEELWGKFKNIAKNKQTSASALIIQYIQNVVSSGSVHNPPKVTPQNIDNLPKLSIQDIEKIIDEKINSSIQAIDNIPNQSIQNIDDINTLSIQDIDNRIAESLADGGIGEAIASSCAGMTEKFNGLLGELQQLKKQMEALKSVPPAPVSEQLTTDNGQLTEDVDRLDSDFASDTQLPIADDIANLLKIGDILSGDQSYDFNYLNSHIGDRLNEHKSQIEAALKIKLSLSEPKYICREFNKILRAMGLTIENKQIKKVETYRVVQNSAKVP